MMAQFSQENREKSTPDNGEIAGMTSDDRLSLPRPAGVSSRAHASREKPFVQLVASFLLGVILSGSVWVYLFYRELRVAEQKLAAQLTQRIALPGLVGTVPNLVPESMNPAPASAVPTSAPTSSTAALNFQPRHVTEKDWPCALFTKEELSQLLETNLTEVSSDSTGCNYKGSDRGSWVRYEITWKGGREALEQRRSAYETLKKRLAPKDMPLHFVPNLGDEAYMTLTGILHVRKGDMAVLFNLMWFQGLSEERRKLLVDTAFARME